MYFFKTHKTEGPLCCGRFSIFTLGMISLLHGTTVLQINSIKRSRLKFATRLAEQSRDESSFGYQMSIKTRAVLFISNETEYVRFTPNTEKTYLPSIL